MSTLRVGIVGASGYSGAVAARLVVAHPSLALAFVTSDKLAGTPARKHLGAAIPQSLTFSRNDEATTLGGACDITLLATPAEVAAELAPKLLAAHPKLCVVDLSGAFRLGDAALYPTHYGFTHPAPDLLASAWYGLPELFGAPPPGPRLVSNPGG